jgi:hypothetical protein
MKAGLAFCINYTGLEDKWLEANQWGHGLCRSNLWRCICCEWCLESRPAALPSATSICCACVHCYAHFLNLALVGTCSTLFPLYVIFFKYALENIHNLFRVCWLTVGSSECFPFKSPKLSSQSIQQKLPLVY